MLWHICCRCFSPLQHAAACHMRRASRQGQLRPFRTPHCQCMGRMPGNWRRSQRCPHPRRSSPRRFPHTRRSNPQRLLHPRRRPRPAQTMCPTTWITLGTSRWHGHGGRMLVSMANTANTASITMLASMASMVGPPQITLTTTAHRRHWKCHRRHWKCHRRHWRKCHLPSRFQHPQRSWLCSRRSRHPPSHRRTGCVTTLVSMCRLDSHVQLSCIHPRHAEPVVWRRQRRAVGMRLVQGPGGGGGSVRTGRMSSAEVYMVGAVLISPESLLDQLLGYLACKRTPRQGACGLSMRQPTTRAKRA